MTNDRLASRLREDGLGLVLYDYEPETLTEGTAAAASSARLWQDRLLNETFVLPTDAVPVIHHRRADESDAIVYVYRAAGYDVHAYHTMNLLAVTLTPAAPGDDPPNSTRETVARRIAQSLFKESTSLQLTTEDSTDGAWFGRHATGAARPVQPWQASLIWWNYKQTWGFAVEKAVALQGGNMPSTAGFSSQQIHMWFDTFGARRYVP